jgi:hypothetical protein
VFTGWDTPVKLKGGGAPTANESSFGNSFYSSIQIKAEKLTNK